MADGASSPLFMPQGTPEGKTSPIQAWRRQRQWQWQWQRNGQRQVRAGRSRAHI